MKYYPLTIAKANFGYGKTINLINYIKNNYSNKFYWYSFKHDQFKDKLMIEELLSSALIKIFEIDSNSIKEKINQFIVDLKQGKMTSREFISQLADIIVANLEGKHNLLVIDNYSYLQTEKKMINIIMLLAEFIYPNLYIIVNTRQKIETSKLSIWRLKEQLLVIDEDDFKLNGLQIKDFLNRHYGLNLTDGQIELVTAETEGWIIVLDYLAKRLKAGADFKNIFNRKSEFMKVLFDLFDYELWTELQGKEKLIKFLLQTSVLKSLQVDICNQLVRVDNSKQLLNEFRSNNGFVIKLAENSYKYQEIFRKFLQSKAEEEYELDKLHRKAAEVYSSNNLEQTLYHLGQQDKTEKIIDLISNKAPKWIDEGSFNYLEESFSYLSDKEFVQHPVLYIYQGDLYFYKQEFKLALKKYQQAKKIYRKEDSEKLSLALIKIIGLYFSLNSVQGLEYFTKLKRNNNCLSDKYKIYYLYLKIKAKLLKKEIDFAEKLLSEVDLNKALYSPLALKTAIIKGEIDKGKKFVKLVDKDKQQLFPSNVSKLAGCNLYLLTGNLRRAREYIWQYKGKLKGL
jgi:ATP/maltotriose-dependent transcriptional regulator MalT